MVAGRHSPVIIIGMHRSGTSMLTRTMQEFGFFMGRGTTRNEECRWTNSLNYWIFRQASATWERPEGVDTVLAESELCAPIEDYLSGVVDGPASIGYLGARRWLRYRSLRRVAEPWGWKDPRNTYTLPLWLKIFPDAKVLHIMRHGVDVAESLRVRHMAAAEKAAERFRRRRSLYVNNPFAPKRSGFAHSPRVRQLGGGLELWEAYTARARSHVQRLGAQALELRYEDLLADPLPHLERVLKFCGIEVGTSRLARAAGRFMPDRAYAFRRNKTLHEFAEKNAPRLAALGY